MVMSFAQCKKIGDKWEEQMQVWMSKHFADTNWTVEDTREVHRDSDGDQFPDFRLVNSETGKYAFIDAKKRNAYYINKERYFGFDEQFYQSYTNIAKKHNTLVYIGFHDPKFDPNHVYVLNLTMPYDKCIAFDNAWGKSLAYRWKVTNLQKFEI